MTINVTFHGGPADGSVQDYPYLTQALPQLYWRSDRHDVGAVYRRGTDVADVRTGTWHYQAVAEDPSPTGFTLRG